MTTYKPNNDPHNLVSQNYRTMSLCIALSKQCSEDSNRVYQTLTADEQSQMQAYMRQGCKMEDGTINVHDCPLTRKMFAGHYTIK